jgi:hypothetical protein
MKIIFLSILFFLSNLVDYKNKDYSFEIKLPKGYEVKNSSREEKFATVEYITISGKQEITNGSVKTNAVYKLICERFTRKPVVTINKLNFHDLIVTYSKNINAASFTANDYKTISQTETGDTINYVLQNDEKNLFENRKIIFHDTLAFSLSVLTRKELFKQEYADEFFDSLIIKK